jgi:P27 family predicted phage terminase small subunit
MQGRAAPAPWLSDEERAAFARLEELLHAQKLHTAAFAESLLLGAVKLAEIHALSLELRRDGLTFETTTTTGAPKRMAHPALGTRDQAMRTLRQVLNDLGLTPTSLGRVDANLARRRTTEGGDPTMERGRAPKPWEEF